MPALSVLLLGMSEEFDTEQQLESMALSAIMDGEPITLTVKVGPQDDQREYELRLIWPDVSDEQNISALTTRFCNGLPPEMVPDADYELARARAVIEALAVGPFEYAPWLPPTPEKVDYKGKKVLRPDTSKVKSRGIIVAFGRKYYEFYSKFQHIGLE